MADAGVDAGPGHPAALLVAHRALEPDDLLAPVGQALMLLQESGRRPPGRRGRCGADHDTRDRWPAPPALRSGAPPAARRATAAASRCPAGRRCRANRPSASQAALRERSPDDAGRPSSTARPASGPAGPRSSRAGPAAASPDGRPGRPGSRRRPVEPNPSPGTTTFSRFIPSNHRMRNRPAPSVRPSNRTATGMWISMPARPG